MFGDFTREEGGDDHVAQMWPKRLPWELNSEAERVLFHAFESQLPDDFTVIHHAQWNLRDPKRHDHHGEIDFLVLHADLGLLLVEVKGGRRIWRDGSTGEWHSKSHNGRVEHIKDPFGQGLRSLLALKAKLDESPTTHRFNYRLQHGVAFPEFIVDKTDIGLDGPRDLILDSSDLFHPEQAIRRICATLDPANRLPQQAIKAVVELIAPTIEIASIGLSQQMLKAEQHIVELTEEQFRTLDLLQQQRRVAVAGCAGSGKTMLAVEKTQRLLNEGYRVLFTCFNANLAMWVRSTLDPDDSLPLERLCVFNYHELVRVLLRSGNIPLPSQPSDPSKQPHYYEVTMPETLFEALDQISLRFDAIIVDEGQDFEELWWTTLEGLLETPKLGTFYVFYDDNQRIYTDRTCLPAELSPATLTINCRNTDPIHEYVMRYYGGAVRPHPHGATGPKPEILPGDTTDQVEILRKVFHQLFVVHRIPQSHVVILTPRGQKTSSLSNGMKVGSRQLSWSKGVVTTRIRVSTIHSFKGLESPVIILMELDRLAPYDHDQLLYVALSRARNHLVVIGNLPEPSNGGHEAEPVVV